MLVFSQASGGLANVLRGAPPAVAAGRKVMWEPTPAAVEQTAMRRFQQSVGVDGGYDELWRWSVEHSDEFWSELMGFVGVEYSGSLSPVKEGSVMPDVTYFPGVQLNFAENMLRHGAPGMRRGTRAHRGAGAAALQPDVPHPGPGC